MKQQIKNGMDTKIGEACSKIGTDTLEVGDRQVLKGRLGSGRRIHACIVGANSGSLKNKPGENSTGVSPASGHRDVRSQLFRRDLPALPEPVRGHWRPRVAGSTSK